MRKSPRTRGIISRIPAYEHMTFKSCRLENTTVNNPCRRSIDRGKMWMTKNTALIRCCRPQTATDPGFSKRHFECTTLLSPQSGPEYTLGAARETFPPSSPSRRLSVEAGLEVVSTSGDNRVITQGEKYPCSALRLLFPCFPMDPLGFVYTPFTFEVSAVIVLGRGFCTRASRCSKGLVICFIFAGL